jgi:hypothetical protein
MYGPEEGRDRAQDPTEVAADHSFEGRRDDLLSSTAYSLTIAQCGQIAAVDQLFARGGIRQDRDAVGKLGGLRAY